MPARGVCPWGAAAAAPRPCSTRTRTPQAYMRTNQRHTRGVRYRRHTHTHTQTRTHARMHERTHTQPHARSQAAQGRCPGYTGPERPGPGQLRPGPGNRRAARKAPLPRRGGGAGGRGPAAHRGAVRVTPRRPAGPRVTVTASLTGGCATSKFLTIFPQAALGYKFPEAKANFV